MHVQVSMHAYIFPARFVQGCSNTTIRRECEGQVLDYHDQCNLWPIFLVANETVTKSEFLLNMHKAYMEENN